MLSSPMVRAICKMRDVTVVGGGSLLSYTFYYYFYHHYSVNTSNDCRNYNNKNFNGRPYSKQRTISPMEGVDHL